MENYDRMRARYQEIITLQNQEIALQSQIISKLQAMLLETLDILVALYPNPDLSDPTFAKLYFILNKLHEMAHHE